MHEKNQAIDAWFLSARSGQSLCLLLTLRRRIRIIRRRVHLLAPVALVLVVGDVGAARALVRVLDVSRLVSDGSFFAHDEPPTI